MLYIGKQLTISEAKKYNRDLDNWRAESTSVDCVSTRACEGCGVLVSDSLCLCMGFFTCPKCGFKNGKEFLIKNSAILKYKPKIEEDYCI